MNEVVKGYDICMIVYINYAYPISFQGLLKTDPKLAEFLKDPTLNKVKKQSKCAQWDRTIG